MTTLEQLKNAMEQVNNSMKTKTFQVNNIYQCRSICNQDCIWTYKVIKRTASTITIKDMDTNKVKTCRVSKNSREIFGCEIIHPLGNYSMAPSLWA